jgi:uncharacterized protein YycO
VILLYKGKSLISKAIRWRTWGPYSHAAWWLSDGSVIEAWHKGGVTHSESPATLHTPGTVIDVFGVPGIDSFAAEQFLKDQIGKKYDFAAVMRGFTFRLDRDNPEKWFCSELVFDAGLAGGFPLLSRIPAWKVDPTKLSYSPILEHVATLTTIDRKDFNLRTVDLQPEPFLS